MTEQITSPTAGGQRQRRDFLRLPVSELLHATLVRANAVTPEDAIDTSHLYDFSPFDRRVKVIATLGTAALLPSILETRRTYVGRTEDGLPIADELHLQIAPDNNERATISWRSETYERTPEGVLIPNRRVGPVEFLPFGDPQVHNGMLTQVVNTIKTVTGLHMQ